MTFREKIELDDPYRLSDHSWGGVTGCPDRYDPECMDKCRLKGGPSEISCNSCWNREIPEEKEKENKSMKKTKAMLEEELEQKRAEIEELRKELVKVEKYKQYDDMAGEIKAIYDSFVNAGFNEDQAYEILIILLQNQKAAPTYTWESYLSKYLDARKKERRNV